jgi:L-alanine-DL-glutamate epimerase-like enolase superfamily enzyme
MLTSEPMNLTTKHVFGISRSASRVFRNVLVTMKAGGLEGFGEAAPSEFYGEDQASTLKALEAMKVELAKNLQLLDPGTGRGLSHQMVNEILDVAEAPCAAARAAVDMALYDILGKETGAPLWRILSLDPSRTPITSFTIGLDEIDVMLSKVEEAKGFPLLKIKLDTGADVGVIAAIRERSPQRIRVDANCAWRPEEAVGVIKKLEALGVEMVEQPVAKDDLDGLKYVSDRVDVPVFADESCMVASDIPALAGRVDGVNIKLMKCGGVTEAIRMIHTARAHGLKVMIGCMIECSIAVTAAAHLTPLVDAADLDGALLLSDDPFTGMTVRDGKIVLPDGPGLGVARREATAGG